MTIQLRRHREAGPPDAAPSIAAPWAARVPRLGLWALVVVGALGGIVAAVRPTTTVIERTAHQQAEPPLGLAGVAEIAARHWLTDDGRSDRLGTTSPTLAVDSTAAVAVRQIAADYWAVTVAAEIREPASTAASLWYLEVGVTTTPQGLRPVGSPAVVPAPGDPTALPGAAASLASPAPGDPLPATAEAFLRALLTGAGDPVRYEAPDAAIDPIGEPPFVQATVDRTAVLESDPTRTLLRVAVNAITVDHIEFTATYELILAERAGRWEIKALSAAPTLPHANAHAPVTSTTTTTTTTSTVQPMTPTSTASPGA